MDSKGAATAILDKYTSPGTAGTSKESKAPIADEDDGDDGEAARTAAGEELARAFGLPASKGSALMAALKDAMEYCA